MVTKCEEIKEECLRQEGIKIIRYNIKNGKNEPALHFALPHYRKRQPSKMLKNTFVTFNKW